MSVLGYMMIENKKTINKWGWILLYDVRHHFSIQISLLLILYFVILCRNALFPAPAQNLLGALITGLVVFSVFLGKVRQEVHSHHFFLIISSGSPFLSFSLSHIVTISSSFSLSLTVSFLFLFRLSLTKSLGSLCPPLRYLPPLSLALYIISYNGNRNRNSSF